MNKYPLIGGSICAVVLLVLASFTNVVGYQTIQSSNQRIIKDEVNQKELLFQTIVDMANNKEIQKVILGSEITGKRFFDNGMIFSTFKFPVITEKFLKRFYTMGVILFRTLSKTKIQSHIEHRPAASQGIQKELSAVVEKDTKLKSEMSQLSSLSCGCENENTKNWTYPVNCILLYPLDLIFWYLWHISYMEHPFIIVAIYLCIKGLGSTFNCFWYY